MDFVQETLKVNHSIYSIRFNIDTRNEKGIKAL